MVNQDLSLLSVFANRHNRHNRSRLPTHFCLWYGEFTQSKSGTLGSDMKPLGWSVGIAVCLKIESNLEEIDR